VNGLVIFVSAAMLYYFSKRVALLFSHDADSVREVLDNDLRVILEGCSLFDRGAI
jgi:hypothetical protein